MKFIQGIWNIQSVRDKQTEERAVHTFSQQQWENLTDKNAHRLK